MGVGDLSVALSLIDDVDDDDAVVIAVAKIGWNAEPSDGRNLNAAGGLNIADDGDKWSVSPDFKQT